MLISWGGILNYGTGVLLKDEVQNMNHDLPVNDCQDRTDRGCGNGRRGDVSSQNSCQYLSFPPGILLTLHKLLRHCVVLCESFALRDAHYTRKRIGPICTNLRIRTPS
jgi:hypothetical protein